MSDQLGYRRRTTSCRPTRRAEGSALCGRMGRKGRRQGVEEVGESEGRRRWKRGRGGGGGEEVGEEEEERK